jgi:D-serine deaminase-like pyridoxal phosphate-dependent protein
MNILTPALIVYPEIVDRNIERTLERLGNNPERWRPHVKTAKLISTMQQMTAHGLRNFKCATTLELRTACEAGAADVLVAFACWGPRAQRVAEIAREFPAVAVSALVEDARNLAEWRGTSVGIFIDVNPGGNRTGIEQERIADIVELARAIQREGLVFRGLHYYDGHHRQADLGERTAAAWLGYDRLMAISGALLNAGRAPEEVVTAGSTALPCSISADAGIPTCRVRGREDLEPLHPSEEHLPIRVPDGALAPEAGELLYLMPRHVCPTVNNFDHAVLVKEGQWSVVPVTARGREAPLAAVQV